MQSCTKLTQTVRKDEPAYEGQSRTCNKDRKKPFTDKKELYLCADDGSHPSSGSSTA